MGELHSISFTLLAVAAALLAVGCASGPPFIDVMQPEAVQVATRRAQFEMNCPTATGELLSREMVEPAVRAPRLGATEHAEYTIGVAGCAQRATYVIICLEDGSGCFARGTRNIIRP